MGVNATHPHIMMLDQILVEVQQIEVWFPAELRVKQDFWCHPSTLQNAFNKLSAERKALPC